MKLAQTTAATTTIDRPTSPTALTCSVCPFARLIEDHRYVCQVSETAADVVRGHWEARTSCYEAIEAAAEQTPEPVAVEVEAPIAQTEATATLAPVATAPTATGENEELPNRGDNGRGRLQPMPVKKVSTVPTLGKNSDEPIATKKLMLTLVAVKRITSDVAASNFDRNELEIAGELSLALGGFVIPPVVVRDSHGYKIISGHFQYHAAVLARQLNPRAGETIPAIILESENQATASAMLKMLKFAA
ncbi:hypothetical protein [Microcoleus sp. MON2_D5]|uniref:hypothetical protein n=1 Tax=Microcoleus sp. MON2_D5 TaxID=2818833 RepID=UPI002FD1D149